MSKTYGILYHVKGYIRYIDDNVTIEYRQNRFRPRRFSGNGVWLCVLLPFALLSGVVKYKCSESYEISTIVAVGLMINSLCRILIDQEITILTKDITFLDLGNLTSSLLISTSLKLFCNKGILFIVPWALFTSFTYHKLLYHVVKDFPLCFTYGEATIVVQSVFIFVTSYITNIMEFSSILSTCYLKSTLLFQGGVFATLLQAALICRLPLLHEATYFYTSFAFVVTVFIILLPYYLMKQNPLLWLFSLIFQTKESILLLCWWITCSIFAALGVFLQVKINVKATTVNRKIFHILALAVFLPGLFVSPCFLYIASGVAFVAISFLEMIRALRISPVGYLLQSGYEVFVDEKDQGVIALTPLYLMAGCSLPIWLYPGSFELLSLPTLAGLFTTALGDSVASTFGTWFGTHRWFETLKTKEGSLFSFLSQLGMFLVMHQSGMLKENVILWPVIVLAVTTIAEAKINQIDNIVLPLMAYTLFMFN